MGCSRKHQTAHVGARVRDGIDEAAFVALRTARDATLPVPALLLPAMQVNPRAGHLPAADAHGIRRLMLPLDAL